MKRYLYYRNITTNNGINIYDLTQINWNLFQFKQDYQEHTLTDIECQKFYLVMQQYYGDLFIEDILYFINRIPDPTALVPGLTIKIPNIQDIRDFLSKYKSIV